MESAVARRALALLWLAFAVYFLHPAVGLGGKGLDSFFNDWLYNGLLVLAALACFARGLLRRDSQRAAWLLVGVALSAWATGDIYYSVALEHLSSIPFPSIDDAFYLAFYPPAYVAIGLFVRSRTSTFRASSWLDGLSGALAVAAVAAAVVFQAVLSSVAGSSPAAVATNLAYPLADLLLLGVLVTSAALSGWRVDRAWGLMAGGLTLFALNDSIYLYQTAAGTYKDGGILDAGWLAACLIFAVAAWQPAPRRMAARDESWRMLAVPGAAAAVGIGLLVVDHFHRLNSLALALAAGAAVSAILRMALTFVEYLRMIEASREEASTDSLTGMANRRRLVADLDEALADRRSAALALFDLDGFKLYNDTYGHPAGDTLLIRLGRALDAAVDGRGRAYRMGGDEFCVLIDDADLDGLLEDCSEALSEVGPGFAIKPSTGSVELPREAQTSADALKTADQRMYQQKRGGRKSAGAPERRRAAGRGPGARREARASTPQASRSWRERVAVRLGLGPDDADEVAARRAATRHRQGGRARHDPHEARPPRGGRAGLHPPSHPDRRADRAQGARARGRGQARALEPRALGRRRLSRRSRRPLDPARSADRGRLRRVPGDGLRPALPGRRPGRRCAARDRALRRSAVRPGSGRGTRLAHRRAQRARAGRVSASSPQARGA